MNPHVTESGRFAEGIEDIEKVERFYRVLRNMESTLEWYTGDEGRVGGVTQGELRLELEVLEAVLVANIEKIAEIKVLQSKADKAQELLGRIREHLANIL